MVKTYIDEFLDAGASLANVAILSLKKPVELQDDLSLSMAAFNVLCHQVEEAKPCEMCMWHENCLASEVDRELCLGDEKDQFFLNLPFPADHFVQAVLDEVNEGE